MDIEALKVIGQVFGIGAAAALGVFFLLFRDLICGVYQRLFPRLSQAQAYRLLILTLVLIWTVALSGIVAWGYGVHQAWQPIIQANCVILGGDPSTAGKRIEQCGNDEAIQALAAEVRKGLEAQAVQNQKLMEKIESLAQQVKMPVPAVELALQAITTDKGTDESPRVQLARIVENHHRIRLQVEALQVGADPVTQQTAVQAREALEAGNYRRANALLEEATKPKEQPEPPPKDPPLQPSVEKSGGISVEPSPVQSPPMSTPQTWYHGGKEPDSPRPLPGGPLDTYVQPYTGMPFVGIPGGCFLMGSPEAELGRNDDERQHKVCVKGFWIGRYEVTQGEWKTVMGHNPSYFAKGDDYPVENVSWNNAQEFIRRLIRMTGDESLRLPTEAEWEYAARAGTRGPYSFEGPLTREKANFGESYDFGPLPVKVFVPNPWGLYQVQGNVWEWTCSVYDEKYRGEETRCAPAETRDADRVLRGGSWHNHGGYVRSASRYMREPTHRFRDLGFRLARGQPSQAREGR